MNAYSPIAFPVLFDMFWYHPRPLANYESFQMKVQILEQPTNQPTPAPINQP